MDKNSKVYIAGHSGLVGSAILRTLRSEGYTNLITRSHRELDLMRQIEVGNFFDFEKPEYVFLAAAKVGGILANKTYPAEFIYDNLMIQANIIHAAYLASVKKLLFLGSSCIYPRDCHQPIKEDDLLTGTLESTNEPYAIAKIAGIKMCQSYNRQYGTQFISVMPTNLYGPNDNFDLESSHVLPALIRKFHLAKLAALGQWEGIKKDESIYGSIPNDIMASLVAIAGSNGYTIPGALQLHAPSSMTSAHGVVLWGTGSPKREFLHVEDLADACLFLMNDYNDNKTINVGTEKEISIQGLAELVRKIVAFEGSIYFDTKKPDGTPRKLLDVSRLESLGWRSKISLKDGIRKTYKWYLERQT